MMSWFGGLYGLITGVTLIILVITAVAVVVTAIERWNRRNDDGEALLRMRYAAGEIDTDEYRKRLTTLRTANGAQR